MLRVPKAQQNSNLSTVAVAALVGGLAGAVVGLMFAPKSGKELRHVIYKKADNALDHVEDVTSQHAETLKHQGTDLVDKGKKLAEDLQTFIQESLRMKKSGYIPINNQTDTEPEDSLEDEAEMEPPVMAQSEIPLKED